MWKAVSAASIPALVVFNYRFVPALRLAKETIDAGELGEIRHVRARYLQEWIADPALSVVWRLRLPRPIPSSPPSPKAPAAANPSPRAASRVPRAPQAPVRPRRRKPPRFFRMTRVLT